MAYSTVKISKIARVRGGKRLPPGQVLVKEETEHPYIRARDIGRGAITFENPVYVSDDVFEKIKRYTVKTNDICVTIVGAYVGDVGIVRSFLSGANLTENAVKITDLVDCEPLFLKYALLSSGPQSQMKGFAAGAAQPKLGIYKVNEVEVPFPNLSTQRDIAQILSTYDDLIENNTRRIKGLEKMAQMLYREWFVHFRFPGHTKLRLVESSLGEIPQGWEVKKLGDVIELAYGKALKAEERVAGPVPVFGSSGIVGFHDRPLANGPGIIVGRKGNVGSVFWTDCDFYAIDTVFFVRTALSLPYVFYSLRDQNFINNDAAVPGLSRSAAYLKSMIAPDTPTLNAFEAVVAPIFSQLRVLREKNSNLGCARDLLLPMLMSGDLTLEALHA